MDKSKSGKNKLNNDKAQTKPKYNFQDSSANN